MCWFLYETQAIYKPIQKALSLKNECQCDINVEDVEEMCSSYLVKEILHKMCNANIVEVPMSQ